MTVPSKAARRAPRFVYTFLLTLLSIAGLAQTKALPEATRRANLETQLTRLEEAFMQEDFETFADMLHPDVLRVAGGADALAGQLRKGAAELTAQGAKVTKVSHGAPSRIVSMDRELQCTVPQITEFQLASGPRTAPSTLLAVSRDGGLTWSFLDTAGKDWDAVHRLVPNLSRELVLPAKAQ
jgi:hypothetical protein